MILTVEIKIYKKKPYTASDYEFYALNYIKMAVMCDEIVIWMKQTKEEKKTKNEMKAGATKANRKATEKYVIIQTFYAPFYCCDNDKRPQIIFT